MFQNILYFSPRLVTYGKTTVIIIHYHANEIAQFRRYLSAGPLGWMLRITGGSIRISELRGVPTDGDPIIKPKSRVGDTSWTSIVSTWQTWDWLHDSITLPNNTHLVFHSILSSCFFFLFFCKLFYYNFWINFCNPRHMRFKGFIKFDVNDFLWNK